MTASGESNRPVHGGDDDSGVPELGVSGGEGSSRPPELGASGEEYNPGPATPVRRAATVILLRGGDTSLEVLLVRRTPQARFMGGVWVFPGGAIDEGDMPIDGTGPAEEGSAIEAHALRAAAVRELREEARIELVDTSELVEFSRWITPAVVRTRFDTHFFLAELPQGQEPLVDGEECVELGWFTPKAALDAHRTDEIVLVFPTIKTLEQLDAFSSSDALLAHARGRDVSPVQPKVVLEGEVARVLLPGDPGY
jgi:8-oxo-dGTP pyrophosphatase MutT (NUDIX family)